MSIRRLLLAIVLVCFGFAAYAYYTNPIGTFEMIEKARIMVAAILPAQGQPSDYSERVKAAAFDKASRERQEEGAAALGQPVSGEMELMVQLPALTPNGMDKAQKISAFLLKNGIVQEIENQFPSIAQTDSHSFTLDAVTGKSVMGPCAAVHFTFLYKGYIRQGDPRKIVDYANSLIEKEVGARCWNVPGFDPNPRPAPIVSPTAIITDLPGEPDTAAAQAKLFKKPAAPVFSNPPASVASTRAPEPSDNPAAATDSKPNSIAPVIAHSGPVAATPKTDDPTAGLHIRKPLPDAKAGTVYVNGMNYATMDEVAPTDTTKLLDQGGAVKTNLDGSPRSPLDQPVDSLTPVPPESR